MRSGIYENRDGPEIQYQAGKVKIWLLIKKQKSKTLTG